MSRGIYAASRPDIPARGAMWRRLRDEGWPIISSWIDKGIPATPEHWQRIEREVVCSAGLVLFATEWDLPLDGPMIEVGMALAVGLPVFAVLPGVALETPSMRPLGSWLRHPRVRVLGSVERAMSAIVEGVARRRPITLAEEAAHVSG